jgi:hypothetical protein
MDAARATRERDETADETKRGRERIYTLEKEKGRGFSCYCVRAVADEGRG